jgi:hypothetical protein
LGKELQSRAAVNKLLSGDIEVLTYAVKFPTGKEALALKQALVSKTSAEEEALLQREWADEVVALAEQCQGQGFEDSLVQVEFFQVPFKVDRSNVYPDQEVHRSVSLEGQFAESVTSK